MPCKSSPKRCLKGDRTPVISASHEIFWQLLTQIPQATGLSLLVFLQPSAAFKNSRGKCNASHDWRVRTHKNTRSLSDAHVLQVLLRMVYERNRRPSAVASERLCLTAFHLWSRWFGVCPRRIWSKTWVQSDEPGDANTAVVFTATIGRKALQLMECSWRQSMTGHDSCF